MHKVFISYHHSGDGAYKERLLALNDRHQLFLDGSVDTGDIDDQLPDSTIRETIRDDYLRDSTVTVVLVGTGTKGRKHVDWEIYSSMYDGQRNKKSGVLAIALPSTGCECVEAQHAGEQQAVYPGRNWFTLKQRTEYENSFPYMPERIVDNLLEPKAFISVANWLDIEADPSKLTRLIDFAYRDKQECKYDLSRSMRRRNS